MCDCIPMNSFLLLLDIVTMVSCVVTLVVLPAKTPHAGSETAMLDQSTDMQMSRRMM